MLQPLLRACDNDATKVGVLVGALRDQSIDTVAIQLNARFVEEGKGNLCTLAVSMLKGAIHMFLSCMYSATSVAWNGIRCDALSLE
jgi:hypothetical protein